MKDDRGTIDALFEDLDIAQHDYQNAWAAARQHSKQRQQIVVRLRDIGVSYGEIARRLGITRAGVQSLLRSRSAR